jgi:hypothetical protein
LTVPLGYGIVSAWLMCAIPGANGSSVHRVHLTLRHVKHTVGVEGDDLVALLRGRDTNGTNATDVTDVAASLGIAVNERADKFEVGMFNDGGDGVAADGSGGPLNDAQHAEDITVRTTGRAAP